MARSFVLVRSVSPFNSGGFSRAKLRFERDWRALEVTDADDLGNEVISPATLAALNAEPFLVVKPASEQEVADLAATRPVVVDKDQQLAELAAKNADLEARLMKLELGAAAAPAKGAKGA
jgi:hypothetical protein